MFGIFRLRVLVWWGCHDSIPLTGWLKQQKFNFLTILEAGLEIEALASLVSPVGLFPWFVGGTSRCAYSPPLVRVPSSSNTDTSRVGLGPLCMT